MEIRQVSRQLYRVVPASPGNAQGAYASVLEGLLHQSKRGKEDRKKKRKKFNRISFKHDLNTKFKSS